MPANLPPQYHEAERKYREASDLDEKIEALEDMLAIIPKHKGTDKLKADLRRRISKHKEQQVQRKGAGKIKTAYSIEKEGAAQVTLIGPPNSGKSSLVTTLTNASPEIAAFPHTTHKPTPGMAVFENIQFQLIDTPPMTREYTDPALIDLLRRTDIIAIVLDITADPLHQLDETISILRENRIYPEGEPVPKDLPKRPFIKRMMIAVNKVDGTAEVEDYEVFCELSGTRIPSAAVSTRSGMNLHSFLKLIYGLSGMIRVFTKTPGKEPDRNMPFVIPHNSTVEELAGMIHKDFLSRMKYARVWGSAVHGQMVQRDYVMQDGDVVEIHM